MSILAIIPARSGSKGIPDKNIKLLDGHPLMAWSIKAGLLSKQINRVIVSTDSQQYADIAKKYGAEVPFLRPNGLSSDFSTDYDFVKHTLDFLKENEGYQPDYVINLRPTTPLREVNIVDKAIKFFILDKEATALQSIHEMPETAYKSYELKNDYLSSTFDNNNNIDKSNCARQSYPKTYVGNGYIDIFNVNLILQNKQLYGNKVMPFKTDIIVEIDTIDEFNYLEYYIINNKIQDLFQ